MSSNRGFKSNKQARKWQQGNGKGKPQGNAPQQPRKAA
jgi:hypothetical protein